jgi:uncharacterized protein YraI
MKLKFFFGACAALAVSTTLNASPARAQYYAYACTREQFSSVNLRRGPSRSYGIIASIPNQNGMRILSWVWGPDQMRWFRVESNGIVGFARADYVCW